jgi:tetratricopeptide (TPR) repeat protein
MIAEEVNRPADVAMACYGLGSSMLLKGEIEDALPFLERGRAISGMAEISYWTLWLAAMIGYAHALRGEGTQARTLLEQTVERSNALNLVRHEAQATTFLSYASRRCDAWPEAAKHARRALHLAQRHNYPDLEVVAYRLLGTAENVGDNSTTSEGEGHLRKAVALAEVLAMRPELAHSHHELGNFLTRTERREEARQHLASALALYRAMDMRFWQQQVETVLAID